MTKFEKELLANELALRNLEVVKHMQNLADDDEEYLKSKQSIMQNIERKIEQYKEQTGKDYVEGIS
jgi:Tfp pilus assembly PilM family ATPase